MSFLYRLGILIILWIQAFFVPGIQLSNGNVSHVSKEDVLLLKDELNPKCFSRIMWDLTCFFETEGNQTYDLLYTAYPPPKRCEISVQRTEEGTFLHICSFPERDVLLFFETYLEVIEPTTNTTLYNRTLLVNKHVLLDPPTDVSLHPNGKVGQLNVSWYANVPMYIDIKVKYRIEYSSGVHDRERKQEDTVLDALIPGEEVKVQVTLKPSSIYDGPWSRWSDPVRAVVPQSTDDIALICFTPDLQNVTCHWNLSKYEEKNFKLFYQTGHSDPLRWTTWHNCVADENITDLCCFHGENSEKVRVKLMKTSGPIRRIFYGEPFTLSNSVKTSPPTNLKRIQNNNKLCLEWEAPLPSLSAHLQYELDHQLKENEGWKFFRPEMVKPSKTDACVEVPAGRQYRVRVRAKPAGHIYSGYWSDWSDVLKGETPTDAVSSVLAVNRIPIFILIMFIFVTTFCSMYISKIKQFLWPPVPNPEKVLQSFLMEINRNKRDPPVLVKQFSEETTTSRVEIMSEGEVSGLKNSEDFSELLSSEGSFTSSELGDGSPVTEVFPDYVTLNKNSIFLFPQGNTYIYEQVAEKGDPEIEDEYLPTCRCSCSDGSDCVSPCLCCDLLNHSYLPLAEPADKFSCKVTAARSPGNIYTNFP